MIEVLTLTDKQVRARLFERALKARRPVMVALVRDGPAMRPIPEREPFLTLERTLGKWLDQVLVADEGKVEGMWRDPVGDLAEALFPDDRSQAYLASGNYLLLNLGRPLGVVKKQPSSADEIWLLQEALAQGGTGVPAPPREERPSSPSRGRGSARVESPGAASGPKEGHKVVMPAVDPWALLGLAPGTPKREAKKAFHALIAQYHPDKVAHLAPEFRALADERTRALLDAWRVVEPQCT